MLSFTSTNSFSILHNTLAKDSRSSISLSSCRRLASQPDEHVCGAAYILICFEMKILFLSAFKLWRPPQPTSMHEDNFCAMVSVRYDVAAKIRPYFCYRISMVAVVAVDFWPHVKKYNILNTYKCQGFSFSTCSTFRSSFLLFYSGLLLLAE